MASRQQALELQVLRLSRPSFHTALPILAEGGDIPGTVLPAQEAANVVTAYPGSAAPHFGTSELLRLPPGFGDIFLGETFSCYISFHNVSSEPVHDVCVKIDLETTTQSKGLVDNSARPIVTLEADATQDFIIQHEVKELGRHWLRCSADYLRADGERISFPRKYKFEVLNPLYVKIKIPSHHDDVFLEAQIQNAMKAPLFLESVTFEPAPEFVCENLSLPTRIDIGGGDDDDDDDEDDGTAAGPSTSTADQAADPNESPAADATAAGEGEAESAAPGAADDGDTTGRLRRFLEDRRTRAAAMIFLKPNDVSQFLYRLRPRDASDPATRSATVIGKLDLVWRTNLGEKGRLQTSRLQRKEPKEVALTIVPLHIPERISVGVPFTVRCRITNNSAATLVLRLYAGKAKVAAVMLNGVSGQPLGEFSPGAAKTVEVSLFPLAPGLAPVAVRLIDVQTGHAFDEELAEVLVEAD